MEQCHSDMTHCKTQETSDFYAYSAGHGLVNTIAKSIMFLSTSFVALIQQSHTRGAIPWRGKVFRAQTAEASLLLGQLRVFWSTFKDRPNEYFKSAQHGIQFLKNLPPDWQPLEALLRRPWFQRIWVLQEVALGKNCIVACGRD